MSEDKGKRQTILVTGGTSGLGLEMVRLFLHKGYNVVATGRQQTYFTGFDDKFTLYIVDFGDLKQVAEVAKRMCMDHSFRFIVNNAGILSPPGYMETVDGIEYTLQINILAHLLVNEFVLRNLDDDGRLVIASVTSPAYRIAALYEPIKSGPSGYRPIGAYSSSKLYLTLLGEFLASRHVNLNLQHFSFDPGTFSSGIHRMQKKWFREMYHIAAPFMRNPARVAKVLAEILLNDTIENGMIYDTLKRRRSPPEMDISSRAFIMNSCFALIEPFLNK